VSGVKESEGASMMRVVSQQRKRVTGAGKGESEIEKLIRGCQRETWS